MCKFDKLLLLVDAGICNMIQALVDAIENKHNCAFELIPPPWPSCTRLISPFLSLR